MSSARSKHYNSGLGFAIFIDKYQREIDSELAMVEWEHKSKRHLTDESLSKRNERLYDLIQKRKLMIELHNKQIADQEDFFYGHNIDDED